MSQPGFHLGNTEAEFVDVRILAPVDLVARDGWLEGQVRISVGSFRGAFRADFELQDFQRFAAELRQLQETLTGQAVFEPTEGQLVLKASGNGRGGLNVAGEAYDFAGENRLVFKLTLDQTYIEPVLRDLDSTLAVIASSRPAAG